jgi:hypothetical protein
VPAPEQVSSFASPHVFGGFVVNREIATESAYDCHSMRLRTVNINRATGWEESKKSEEQRREIQLTLGGKKNCCRTKVFNLPKEGLRLDLYEQKGRTHMPKNVGRFSLIADTNRSVLSD